MSGGQTPGTAFAVAQHNPFALRAGGAKIPDMCTYPTATARQRAVTLLSSDSGGYCAEAFLPEIATYRYVPLNTSFGTITWSGGTSIGLPNLSGFATQAAMYRICGWGIRMTTDLSLFQASGHVYVGQFAENYFTDTVGFTQFPTTEAGFEQSPCVVKVSLSELAQRPIMVASHIQDSGICNFRDVNGPTGTIKSVYAGGGWPAIVVFGSGLPVSSAVLNIEVIYHLEYIVDPNAYGIVDSMPFPYNPQLIAAVTQVSVSEPVAYLELDEKEDKDIIGRIESFVDSASANFSRTSNLLAKSAALANGVSRAYNSVRSVGFRQPFALQF